MRLHSPVGVGASCAGVGITVEGGDISVDKLSYSISQYILDDPPGFGSRSRLYVAVMALVTFTREDNFEQTLKASRMAKKSG